MFNVHPVPYIRCPLWRSAIHQPTLHDVVMWEEVGKEKHWKFDALHFLQKNQRYRLLSSALTKRSWVSRNFGFVTLCISLILAVILSNSQSPSGWIRLVTTWSCSEQPSHSFGLFRPILLSNGAFYFPWWALTKKTTVLDLEILEEMMEVKDKDSSINRPSH